MKNDLHLFSIGKRIKTMKPDSNFVKALFIFLLPIICINVNSQKLIESRQTSYYTYIYKLTDKEAKKIYENDIWKVDASFFHTLVDSFPTDSIYKGKLAEGHYLQTFSEKDKQKLSITTVQNFEIFILNNNTDLCIQVFDLHGNIIPDADVRVRWKKLHYNKKTQSYVDKKSNQKGLLKVTHNGFTAYYNLKRQYGNSCIKRGTRKIVYGTPLRYAWLPVNYIIYLPIDGAKSIIKGWPQGTIYRTKNFFIRSFHKFACIFDDDYCDYYANNRFNQKHTGYIVFNKPKYHPGDTVKFKAFLVTKKGKAIDKSVKIILQTNRKNVELTTLKPYQKGGYEHQFLLHDSLQLQLDRNYDISLERNERKSYMSGSFKYEDYELAKNKLSVRIDGDEHYRRKDFKLYVKGTDENDLNLLDARIELLVRPNSINKYFGNHVFIPDTIMFIEKKLEQTGETEVLISDSIFPSVNFDYDIIVRLLTSDNEAISENKKVQYYYESEKFDIKLLSDSIRFTFNKNGVSTEKKVFISAYDNFGNKTRLFNGKVPYKVELNPYYSSYTIESDRLSETIDISAQPSLLQCFSERTRDSVFIVVDNPRKIPFSYNIYLKNTNKPAGFADSLNIKQKSSSKQNYFVSIRYLWGGKVKEENYRIPLIDKKLNISVKQPKIVYPGQKSKFEILVTDLEGKPVEGVDLTAYALTKKFNYSAPDLPYLGNNRRNRTVINNFSFKNFKLGQHTGLSLDYNSWKLLASLDSIEYYKFIYPENRIYRFEYYTSDSLTQFAPFVTSNGAIQRIHVIYVDSKPVYFSWSTNTQPYSFKIESGFHQIKLRTNYRNITIDSLYFNKSQKLIFSLNENLEHKKVKIEKVKPELSDYEQRLLSRYIFPYRNTFGERYAYIEQDENIQFLAPQTKNQIYSNMAGPIVGNVSFNLLDSFSTEFNHEPFFEYEFAPKLLKMRSLDVCRYPKFLFLYNNENGLNDQVFTKNSLYKQWSNYLDSKRYSAARYKYPQSTSQGFGRLLINFATQKENPVKDIPLNILVLRYDSHEFLRVYPGNISLIHQLEEGYYKLIFFYPGAKYHIEDSIYIKPNGLNYYEFRQPQVFNKDTFSVYVSKRIEETIFKPVPYSGEEAKELKQIYDSYQQQFRYTGEGEFIDGHVYDKEANEPLPGVNIIIKGTTYGTVADINGYYSLKVPSNNNVLIFSFVGYIQEEKQIGYDKIVNAILTPDVHKLEEVVVVGYGFQRKSELTGSVSTITSQSLLGGIPGVSGNISQALQGRLAGVDISAISSRETGVEIRVRGASTVKFERNPLYVINGNVFTGNISELDPSLIQNIEILKDENAIAIYGARGANGVVIIETKAGAFKSTIAQTSKGADFDHSFFEAASHSGSIRNNFSDYAFWQPKLTTNKEGKASFEVTFPDDVTSWETFYLAMNGNKQSGQTKSLIKSYKPLMAQLAIPRFLVQNDTTFVIGKVLNYSNDSVEVTTRLEVNKKNQSSKTRYCLNSLVDTFLITPSDTLSIKYLLEKADGYFDGELRNIPVFPIGLEETKGNFTVLDKDTTFKLSFDSTLGEVNLYARADILEVIEDEISNVIRYKYSCNEQIASKLKALLAEKNIAQFRGQKFKKENEVDKLIRLLRKNQKDDGLWGWWKDSEENEWISLHVLEALSLANKLGYNANINKGQLTEKLIWKLENSKDFYAKVRILKILNLLGSQISYKPYIKQLEKAKKLSLNGLLQIMELKQLCKLDFNIDTLVFYRRKTLFGNIYYSDEKQESNLLNSDIQNTLLAYKLIKAGASSEKTEILRKVRNYFLENRKTGYWRNTYESSLIIETILPDLLGKFSTLHKPSLKINGGTSKTITEFPFEMKINPNQNIEISKTGDFPIYLTNYQRYWNKTPKSTKSDFEIVTHFDNDSASFLKAGKGTILVADVLVKKDAEYVMINIPIPGGCSYTDKKNNFRNESHREYFKNETSIFCNYLSKGRYTFEIKLISRYSGTYTLNPAKIELMYFPVFNANNEIKKIKVQ